MPQLGLTMSMPYMRARTSLGVELSVHSPMNLGVYEGFSCWTLLASLSTYYPIIRDLVVRALFKFQFQPIQVRLGRGMFQLVLGRCGAFMPFAAVQHPLHSK